MSGESFEQRMERACRDREIPGAVLVAGDRKGKLYYEKAFGYRSLKDPSNPDPMPIDATMWLASCTKLIGTIAAMQCVERGQLKLDEDVTAILPELKGIQILKGFEKGPDGADKPILVPNTKTITLRHLLTHSSGLSYDFFNPVLMRFRATQKVIPNLHITKPMREAYLYPLLFAPGEEWEYGVGIDWAGWMVERVNGNISLQDYLETYVYGPLGIKGIAFYPKTKPATWAKMTDMSERSGGINRFGVAVDPEGKVEYTKHRIWNPESSGISAGAGGYGPPVEYYKILQSILLDDEKILKKETVEEMFRPQLSESSRKSYIEKLKIPEVNQGFGPLPLGCKVDWGLGGNLIMENLAGRRNGTMAWSGYPNLHWFVDRVGGIAGIYGSQINPPGDLKTVELFKLWEKELYSKSGKEKL